MPYDLEVIKVPRLTGFGLHMHGDSPDLLDNLHHAFAKKSADRDDAVISRFKDIHQPSFENGLFDSRHNIGISIISPPEEAQQSQRCELPSNLMMNFLDNPLEARTFAL